MAEKNTLLKVLEAHTCVRDSHDQSGSVDNSKVDVDNSRIAETLSSLDKLNARAKGRLQPAKGLRFKIEDHNVDDNVGNDVTFKDEAVYRFAENSDEIVVVNVIRKIVDIVVNHIDNADGNVDYDSFDEDEDTDNDELLVVDEDEFVDDIDEVDDKGIDDTDFKAFCNDENKVKETNDTNVNDIKIKSESVTDSVVKVDNDPEINVRYVEIAATKNENNASKPVVKNLGLENITKPLVKEIDNAKDNDILEDVVDRNNEFIQTTDNSNTKVNSNTNEDDDVKNDNDEDDNGNESGMLKSNIVEFKKTNSDSNTEYSIEVTETVNKLVDRVDLTVDSQVNNTR